MALDRKVARANKAKAQRKFAVLASLNRMQDAGEPVHAAKRALSNDWQKRQSNNVRGTFNPKHAAPSACVIK